MSIKNFPSPPRGTQPAEKVRSNIIYQLVPNRDEGGEGGSWRPRTLGAGRFATVYKAEQYSAGQNIREVAIKILHHDATHNDEYLFDQEVELLKDLTGSSQVHIMNTLDIVQLEPMVMCGCGTTYRPYCPRCGKHMLERSDPPNKDHPSLVCPGEECGYELPGDEIRTKAQYEKLLRPPAKNCPSCKDSPRGKEGALINFVKRPAVVMELLEVRLDQFADYRKRQIEELCRQYSLQVPRGRGGPMASIYSTLKGRPADDDLTFRQRGMVLDKMMLMVQLAEAVAWLHGDRMSIVHKDLTPDNIMVQFAGELSGAPGREVRLATRGMGGPRHDERAVSYRDVIGELVSHPNYSVKVIDFGLADRRKASRKWYDVEDIRKGGLEKWAYLSPEGFEPIIQSNNAPEPLVIDTIVKRFAVPPVLLRSETGLLPGDVLAFPWDRSHDHDLEITKLEHATGAEGQVFAYFDGTPPPDPEQRHFQLVHKLGVAHDLYSLGALFYFLLTEDHQEVAHLRSLVGRLQGLQRRRPDMKLTPRELRMRDGYVDCRDRIPLPDEAWRDRIMELILRAMIRGVRDYSFNDSRIDTGATSSQRLLGETKRLYRELQQEILARPRLHRLRVFAAVAATACLLGGLGSGFLYARRLYEAQAQAPKAALQSSMMLR